MKQQLYYDGRSLSDFGVFISGEGTYGAPARSVTEEAIPGRNGTLVIDNGRFENLEVIYPAFIIKNFAECIRNTRNWIKSRRGYVKIEDTYHPEEYRLGVYASGLDVETSGHHNRHGKFSLAFNCKPQRFLRIGEEPVEFTSNGTIYNPTYFDAKPMIKAYGQGTLTVNGVEITLATGTPYTNIDCDLMDCSYGTQNENKFVTIDGYDFPVLSPGSNSIQLGSGITKIVITPRWWII